VACGAKHSLYNISHVLVQEGDEVIIPAPYWVSYPDQVVLAGGKPVFIETDETTAFKITPEKLEKAISKNTRALVLNSPVTRPALPTAGRNSWQSAQYV